MAREPFNRSERPKAGLFLFQGSCAHQGASRCFVQQCEFVNALSGVFCFWAKELSDRADASGALGQFANKLAFGCGMFAGKVKCAKSVYLFRCLPQDEIPVQLGRFQEPYQLKQC